MDRLLLDLRVSTIVRSLCFTLLIMFGAMAFTSLPKSTLALSSRATSLRWLRLTPTIKSLIVSNQKATSTSCRYSTLPSVSLSKEEHDRAQRFVKFLDRSSDPFHAVQTVIGTLQQAGFQEVSEDEDWNLIQPSLRPGGKYFFTRQDSSIVAFMIGKRFVPGNGFKILAAHTDSPHLKLKPKSKRGIHSGVVQLNVECYGGGLWHTWFDRDLCLSGRVMVRDMKTNKLEKRFVNINRPILRIPNLCIHLRNTDERDVFKFNKEDHLQPILCDHANLILSGPSTGNNTSTSTNRNNTWSSSQEPLLISLIAQHLQCNETDIADFELSLYDAQTAAMTGMMSEYVCGARLDNLASCFTIMEAMVDHASQLDDDAEISIMALFDHEEVGSDSVVGAGSTLVTDNVDRLSSIMLTHTADNKEYFYKSKARSFIMSVDMAHAVHPNYSGKHDRSHAPTMNNGLVVKSNSNQRYATSGLSGFIVREIGRKAGVNMQEFAVRNDCPCGSTIGPILSTKTGIRAVDIGMPQLSMHSIREMMGSKDLSHAHELFTTFLKEFPNVDANIR